MFARSGPTMRSLAALRAPKTFLVNAQLASVLKTAPPMAYKLPWQSAKTMKKDMKMQR